tara:strand:- start:472 stop:1032 length:561 start_codon:yes stop_codon:yes gene_type:complete
MDKKSYKNWFVSLVSNDLYKMPLKTVLEVGESDEELLDLFIDSLNKRPDTIRGKKPHNLLKLLDKKVNTYNIEKFNKKNKKDLPSEIDVIYINDSKINVNLLKNCYESMHEWSLLFIKNPITIKKYIKKIVDLTITRSDVPQLIKVLRVSIDDKIYNLLVLSKHPDMIEQSEFRIQNLLDLEKNEF